MNNMKKNTKKVIGITMVISIAFFVFFCVMLGTVDDDSRTHSDKQNAPQIVSGTSFLSKNDTSGNSLKIISPNDLMQESAFDNNIFSVTKNKPIRTNQWFSSLYFMPTSESLFAYPLAVRFSEKGLSISYPQVNASEDVVFGSFSSDINIVFTQKLNAVVEDVDDLSIKVALQSIITKDNVCVVTITRGSPYLFIMLKDDTVLQIDTSGSELTQFDTFWRVIKNDDVQYGIFGFDGVTFEKQGDSSDQLHSRVSKKDALLTVGVRAKNLSWEMLQAYAHDPIIESEVSFMHDGDDYFNVFDIKTREGNKTLWGLLPHHIKGVVDVEECIINEATFQTIRGKQQLCRGNHFYVNNKRQEPHSTINVRSLGDSERSQLEEFIKTDIENFVGFSATDTYFLGKELLRAAHLYDFAMQLGLHKESEKMKKALQDELYTWHINTQKRFSPESGKYLTYDNKIRGIVGHKPSFGSDKFNDHHFHYGYFVHTAAILGKYDEEFVLQNKELINLFVKDYVNIDRDDEDFPLLRAFDLFEGHSWASGNAQFGDGNDQESSSEAVHAYYAAFLWASILKNDILKETSLWLYNQESNAASFYWMLSDEMSPRHQGYNHSAVSMLWGGKSEWSTWFSGESEAKLGIQLIPFTAGSEYLAYTPKQIEKHLSETAFPEHKMFFDQLLMYKALLDSEEALRIFWSVEDEDIDGGNSRSFLYAWIVTH